MIYLIPFLVILLDQLTKAWALSGLSLHRATAVIPGFNLFLTFNPGISFSFLTSNSPAMPWILSAFALIICGLIVYWLGREQDRMTRIGLTLILGGALGNVIDRIRFGAVVDFLDFYIGDYHWPAFNIADSAICIGVALILIRSLQKKEKK